MKCPKILKIMVRATSFAQNINGSMVGKTVFNEVDAKFTEILSKTLGFSYQLLDGGITGNLLSNGSWTGMLGAIQRNETDLVISSLAITDSRLEVADFSYPFYRSRVTFATRKPEYSPRLDSFLLPFSTELWMCIALIIPFISMTFSALLEKHYSLAKIVFNAYSSLVNQAMTIEPKEIREYLLVIFWQIGCMFLQFCYLALLLSYLTIPALSGVSTIAELAEAVAQGKYECTALPGTGLPMALSRNKDSRLSVIGQNILQSKMSKDIDAVLGNKKSIKKMAYVAQVEELLPLRTKYFISKDEFFPALRAVAMRKGFCLKDKFDSIAFIVWSSGIYERVVEDSVFKESLKYQLKSLYSVDEQREAPLTLDETGGIFFVLIFGYIMGIIVLICEIVISKTIVFERLWTKLCLRQ